MGDEVRIRDGADGTTIDVTRRMIGPDDEADRRTTILVTDEGVRFDEEIAVPQAWNDLARVGVRFDVPSELDRLQWMGPGPDETYPDRCGAAMVARWESTVTDQYHPFVVPQDHGIHVDTRWFALADASGRGFRVDADSRFVFAARHHHDQDLDDARSIAELVRGETIEVHIDAAVRGLGTAACGPDVLAPYRVGPGVHRFSYVMRPVGPAGSGSS
jgi:beta-galactosidase